MIILQKNFKKKFKLWDIKRIIEVIYLEKKWQYR